MKLGIYPKLTDQKSFDDVLSRIAYYFNSQKDVSVVCSVKSLGYRDNFSVPEYLDQSLSVAYKTMKDGITLLDSEEAFCLEESLSNLDIVFLWCDVERSKAKLLNRTEGGALGKVPKLYEVDSAQTRKEGSYFIDALNECYTKSQEKAEIQDNRERFESLVKDVSDKGAGGCYIVATGPSSKIYRNFDYSSSAVIVCNSVIKDDGMMQTLDPDVVAFGDPIFHFGPSAYAREFVDILRKRCEEYDFSILTTFKNYWLLCSLIPEYKERIIAIPFRYSGEQNIDLTSEFRVRTTGNILTLLMIPVAASLSRDIRVLGCDGRRVEDNSYFWSHNPEAQLVDKMSNIQEAHPAFFDKVDHDEYYASHCETLERQCQMVEGAGGQISTFGFSFIPALSSRRRYSADPFSGKKIVVMDPDSSNNESHFLGYSKFVRDELIARGMDVYCLSSKDIELECVEYDSRYIPIYSDPTIAFGKCTNNEFPETFYRETKSFVAELDQSENQLLYMYHGSLAHALALSRICDEYKNVRIVMCMYWNQWEGCVGHDSASLQSLLKSDGYSSGRLKLTAPCKEVSEKFGNTYVAPLTFPSMIYPDREVEDNVERAKEAVAARPDGLVDNNFVVMFPGSSRAGKGFNLAVEVANKLGNKPEFEIVVRDRDLKKNSALDRLPASVSILRGNLSRDELVLKLQHSHVCVFPYEPNTYQHRTSGLFVDTLYSITPVIMRRGCQSSSLVEFYECGVVVDDFSDETVSRAIEDIRENYSNYYKRTIIAAESYRHYNSRFNHVSQILNLFGHWDAVESYSSFSVRGGTRSSADIERSNKKRILLIGNGPSTKLIDKIGFPVVGEMIDTVGMTTAYRYYEHIGWWPTYYVLGDRKVVYCHRENFSRLLFDDKVTTKKFFLSWQISEEETDRFELVRHSSTGSLSIQKAIDLGYEEIFLIGVDGNYVEELPDSRSLSKQEISDLGYDVLNLSEAESKLRVITKTPDSNPNYFYDWYQMQGDVYSLPQAHTHKKNAERVSDAVSKKHPGANIWNLSGYNTSSPFPYMSLDEFLYHVGISHKTTLSNADESQLSSNVFKVANSKLRQGVVSEVCEVYRELYENSAGLNIYKDNLKIVERSY